MNAPARDRAWLTYGPVLGGLGLLAGALLVTAASTYVSVHDASRMLVRGQTDVLERSIRSHLWAAGEPTSGDLDALLEEESGSGLRFLGYVDRTSGLKLQAGQPTLPLGDTLEGRTDRLEGDRLRVVFPLGARRPLRRASLTARPRSAWVVMELEPVQARALRGAANRTLAAGSLAALVFLGMATFLFRRALRRETLRRQEEQARRLASLGEMSAVLAHEIRNPLASLKGNAQLLEQMLPAGDRSQAKAQRVVGEAVRLEHLTNDLLDYVRAGQLQRHEVDVGALVRDAAASVDLAIQVDITQAPARWNVDADRFRQVLVNLLENAVQAGPPVTVSARNQGSALCIEVCDHGPGVPPEERDRIFEPFYTRKTRGTGLGLAVARRVVELHGGALTVTDARGGGACFRVQL